MKVILANGRVIDAVEVFPFGGGNLSVWTSGPEVRADDWVAPPDFVLAAGAWIAYRPQQHMRRYKKRGPE